MRLPANWKSGALSVLFAFPLIAVQSFVFADTRLVDQSLKAGQNTFPIKLPVQFHAELLTTDLDHPRILHFDGERLFIGSRSGNVYWMDPPYTDPGILLSLPDYPHSVVVYKGMLLFAQTSSISSAPYTGDVSTVSAGSVTKLVSLPGGRGHNSRTLKLGLDNKLYVSLGIRANCSDEYLGDSYTENSRRGGIFRVAPDANNFKLEPYASGLRNPVGMAWHPQTQILYSSNNGPDHLGFESPPEYFSKVEEASFHGMPWYQFDGEKIIRDDCIRSSPPHPLSSVKKPVAVFPPRSAPMDMVFFDGSANASQFRNDALVALHGSWATDDGSRHGDGDPASRREPKLVRIKFTNGQAGEVVDFMTGFQLPDGSRWARPVGVAIGPDGDIYFTSDDGIQGLYRIKHTQ